MTFDFEPSGCHYIPQRYDTEPVEGRPSVDEMLLAAWKIQNPGSASEIQKLGRFPQGFWPEIARRVVNWERRGFTAEQIEAEVVSAVAYYANYFSHQKSLFEAETKPKTKHAKSKLAADLLKDISF